MIESYESSAVGGLEFAWTRSPEFSRKWFFFLLRIDVPHLVRTQMIRSQVRNDVQTDTRHL